MLSILFLTIIISQTISKDLSKTSLNEYDTYNPECARIRRPWHKLTTTERDLYTSGLLQLRENGNGNLDEDELSAIASVHEDPLPYFHHTSSYLFWHGYLVWELESRIRNLGGKWSCFGMPYWDFTIENGREDHPSILEQDIGGNGDPDNYWTVNEYSWFPTIEQYWVPYNCIAKDDKYPFCSLKRVLNTDFSMPSAEQIGTTIINNPNFIDFADYSHISGSAAHLIDSHGSDMDDIPLVPQAYEPIWYLFHSTIQYHQALWVDCNDYDLINVDDLDKHSEAFTSFCNSKDGCQDDTYDQDTGDLNSIGWGLDDPLPFLGTLGSKEWSYIYDHELTPRKLYMLPRWNIVYDLDDGEGFYTMSGLADYCRGKLNNHWFVVDKLSRDEDQILSSVNDGQYLFSGSVMGGKGLMVGLFVIIAAAGIIIQYLCGYSKRKNLIKIVSKNYGSV